MARCLCATVYTVYYTQPVAHLTPTYMYTHKPLTFVYHAGFSQEHAPLLLLRDLSQVHCFYT
jgi:hypothetical protein